jgi:hypothetical protein
MGIKPFDAGAYVDGAAAAVALPIAPEHRAGVILNLERLAAMAQLVMAFPLAEETAPEPNFRA